MPSSARRLAPQKPHCSPATRPLKILQVVPYDLAPQAGGVKHHALQLMEALMALGDEVHLAGPSSRPLIHPRHHRLGDVINIPGNGSDNFITLSVSPWAVRRLIAQQRFDIIHLHEPQTPLLNYWVTLLSCGVAKVATFHCFAEKSEHLWLRRLTARLLGPHIQRRIAVSNRAQGYASQSFDGPMAIIPNGVNMDFFQPASQPKIGGPTRFVFVGRLGESRKGAKVALQAYSMAQAAGADIALDVVGDPSGFGVLPDLAGVTYHTALAPKDFAQLFATSDCLLAPATGQESFGMILIEAMACGLEVICSSIAGYRDVAQGSSALFVAPKDPVALAQAITTIAQKPVGERQKTSAIHLKHAAAYAWPKLVGQVRATYIEALEAKK